MSVRSYSKVWLHIIWGTQNREKLLTKKELRKNLSEFLHNYSKEKQIHMKVNYVSSDHVHVLVDLPTNKTIAEVIRLLKGSSSSWVNKQVSFKFAWAKGYAAFSVSQLSLGRVVNYINDQEEHHKTKSFSDEFAEFITKYKIVLNR